MLTLATPMAMESTLRRLLFSTARFLLLCLAIAVCGCSQAFCGLSAPAL